LEDLKGRDHLEDLGIEVEDNIRMALRDIGWEGVDWIHIGQDRYQQHALVNMVMNLQVP
jgi:hypothetical protein